MARPLHALRNGRVAAAAAAGWSVFDALVHVAVDQVEPPRIAGNVAAIVAAALVVGLGYLGRGGRISAVICGLGAGLVLGFNGAWVAAEQALPVPAAIFIIVAFGLLVWAAYRFLVNAGQGAGAAAVASVEAAGDETGDAGFPVAWAAITGALLVAVALVTFLGGFFTSVLRQLHTDELEAADYWSDELVILSAGFGFDGIVGVPDDDLDTTREVGAAWFENPACVNDDGPLSSAVVETGINRLVRGEASFDDGLPIVTSWPVLPSTLHPEDFLFTLNDGSQVVPNAVTMVPNWELNERTTIVVFGDFGNRLPAEDPGQLFPVKLEVVDDGSPPIFVGPDGVTQSGVGLTFETDSSPYNEGPSGPRLVGAKLNRIGDEPEGEGGVGLLETLALPNDEFALYGGGDFKVRILTTGGFSPDGLTGVTPDQYEDFFRLHATGPGGETVLMTEVGVDYDLDGGTLRVVGLSDLGQAADDGDINYDDCYFEDSDNYIDVILEGDEAAARGLTFLEIPAGEDDAYLSFYNPGGPGPEPFPEVTYNAPGPRDLEPIINALDNPMRVSYP
ncbi:MAG: hypothetical protein AAF467_25185 [Actinomycetota bacterium]